MAGGLRTWFLLPEAMSRKDSTPRAPYQYRGLKPDHIRILRLYPPAQHEGPTNTVPLQCEITHIPLDTAGDYEALSYVWGISDRTRTIRIGGLLQGWTSIRITENLFTAMLHLRYAKVSRDLWIDQICINQDNMTEKNAQVSRMGEIYSKARCTVVWLGIEHVDSWLLKDMYTQLSTLSSNKESSSGVLMLDQQALVRLIGTSHKDGFGDGLIQKRRQLLESFLGLPWFGRAWVYQEAVVAPRVEMLWGDIVLPLDFVTGLVVSVYGIAKSAEDGRWHKRIKKTKGFAPLRTIYHDRHAHKERSLDFLNVLWHARKHLNASDPRDYVFAFRDINKHSYISGTPPQLVIPTLQDLIIPDYNKSVADVYTDLALAAIKYSRSLEIFRYIVPTSGKSSEDRSPSHNIRTLPTWVPNWADRTFKCGSPIFVPGVPNHHSASRSRLDPRLGQITSHLELPLYGRAVGRIRAVLPHSFQHIYFSPTLKKAFQLGNMETLLDTHMNKLAQQMDMSLPDWFKHKPKETLLRTILADGSFSTNHEITHPIKDLLRAYENEDNHDHDQAKEADENVKLRHYLRQAGEISSGKKVFLTEGLDVGLGFSTVREGDVICILCGSTAPCVLRKVDASLDRYTFVGLCYLHGWMDGRDDSWGLEWWNELSDRFVLV